MFVKVGKRQTMEHVVLYKMFVLRYNVLCPYVAEAYT